MTTPSTSVWSMSADPCGRFGEMVSRGRETTSICLSSPAAPSAPRAVQVSPVGTTLIVVSWLPPVLPNGVLTSYSLRVLTEPEGEEFHSLNIPVSVAQQQTAQSTTLSGLDLVNVGYRVLVSASTSAGMGPSADPISIGAEVSSTVPPQTTPTATTGVMDTSSIDVETTPGDTTATPSVQTTPTTAPTTAPTNETITRDDVYYVIRIVPPMAAAFLLVALVLIVVFCYVQRRAIVKRRSGRYHIQDESKNQYR